IGLLYESFMAEDDIEQMGTTPIDNDISRVESIASIEEFAATLGEFDRDGISGAFGLYVDTDPANPDQYVVALLQGGIGLPDESYYREDDYAELREQYLQHIERMLDLVGLSDPGRRAQRVFDLEKSLAAAHWDQVRSRDVSATYNPMDRAGLEELAPQFPWATWLEHLQAPEATLDALVVAQPEFFTALSEHMTDENLPSWRDWLAFNVISAAAPYLSSELVTANFNFYGQTVSGTPQQRERWKRGVSLVEGALGEAVGELYVAEYFPPMHKARMQQLVENLIEAYRRNISELPWMTDATR